VLQNTEQPWRLAVDTSLPSPADIEIERPRPLDRPSYMVPAHTVVVLVADRIGNGTSRAL